MERGRERGREGTAVNPQLAPAAPGEAGGVPCPPARSLKLFNFSIGAVFCLFVFLNRGWLGQQQQNPHTLAVYPAKKGNRHRPEQKRQSRRRNCFLP